MRSNLRARMTAAASVLGAFVVALFLALGSAGPTAATTTPEDGDRVFPVIVPDWYISAQGPSYVSGAQPVWKVIDNDIATQDVTYWSPSGGFPGDTSPDIEISQTAPAGVDYIQFDLGVNAELMSELGTSFTDGLLLPATSDDEIPDVQFIGSRFTVTRPAVPAECSAVDGNKYTMQVALHTASDRKYLIGVTALFDARPDSDIAVKEARCNPVEVAPAIEDDLMFGTEPDASTEIPESSQYNVFPPLFIVLGVLAAIFGGVVLWKRHGTRVKAAGAAVRDLSPSLSTAENNHDGTPRKVTDTEPIGADTSTSTTPKPSGTFGKWLLGKKRDDDNDD